MVNVVRNNQSPSCGEATPPALLHFTPPPVLPLQQQPRICCRQLQQSNPRPQHVDTASNSLSFTPEVRGDQWTRTAGVVGVLYLWGIKLGVVDEIVKLFAIFQQSNVTIQVFLEVICQHFSVICGDKYLLIDAYWASIYIFTVYFHHNRWKMQHVFPPLIFNVVNVWI